MLVESMTPQPRPARCWTRTQGVLSDQEPPSHPLDALPTLATATPPPRALLLADNGGL